MKADPVIYFVFCLIWIPYRRVCAFFFIITLMVQVFSVRFFNIPAVLFIQYGSGSVQKKDQPVRLIPSGSFDQFIVS